MQFAHSGSETEKQPQPHPAPTHATSPRRPTAPHPRRSTAPNASRPTAPRSCLSIATSPRHPTVPLRVRLAPPRHCSRAAGNLKTKIGLYCNFFAITDCRRTPNREFRLKNTAKTAHFRFSGTERNPQSQNSCKKAAIFVFAMSCSPESKAHSLKKAKRWN